MVGSNLYIVCFDRYSNDTLKGQRLAVAQCSTDQMAKSLLEKTELPTSLVAIHGNHIESIVQTTSTIALHTSFDFFFCQAKFLASWAGLRISCGWCVASFQRSAKGRGINISITGKRYDLLFSAAAIGRVWRVEPNIVCWCVGVLIR